MSLSSAELTAMRDALAGLVYPDTCTIQRATYTRNSIGEAVPGWASVGTAIPCRLARPDVQVNVVLEAEQAQSNAVWNLTVAWNTDINVHDRVLLAGETFEVIKAEQVTSWLTATRCDLKRLE